ncbi:MAG: UDP-glucose 4-epimerase GalE [Acidimicrobiales bacterium]|nr:UDP-glucose 4-epimerase GalE [Acidimicrobiales bacterium]
MPHPLEGREALTLARVLVTGGAGFIGSHTCVSLIEAGFEPVIVDSFANSSPAVIDRIRSLTGCDVEAHRIDVRDTAELSSVLERGIDAVIHFAAMKAVGESVGIPLDYYDVNVGGTVSLLRAMRDVGVPRLVFSSSCSIFGAAAELPIDVDAPVAPTNPYAQTKAICEQILVDFIKAEGIRSAMSLRYFNPIGAHPTGTLGEDPLGIPNNLLPYAMQVAVGRRAQLSVFGVDYPTSDGTCVRDYIHVCDVAAAHVRALDRIWVRNGHEVANLGTGHGTSVLELVDRVRHITGHEVPVVPAARRPGDVPALVADASVAQQLLGWQCQFGLDDMIEHAWRFQREHPGGLDDDSAPGEADTSRVSR